MENALPLLHVGTFVRLEELPSPLSACNAAYYLANYAMQWTNSQRIALSNRALFYSLFLFYLFCHYN